MTDDAGLQDIVLAARRVVAVGSSKSQGRADEPLIRVFQHGRELSVAREIPVVKNLRVRAYHSHRATLLGRELLRLTGDQHQRGATEQAKMDLRQPIACRPRVADARLG